VGRGGERRQRDWLRSGIVPLDYPKPVAADRLDLLAIVETQVKPERNRLGENGDARRRKKFWWLWGRYTPGMFSAIASLDRVLVRSLTSAHFSAFTFLPNGLVYDQTLLVFAFDNFAHGDVSFLGFMRFGRCSSAPQ
jgi:hypothetical protein